MKKYIIFIDDEIADNVSEYLTQIVREKTGENFIFKIFTEPADVYSLIENNPGSVELLISDYSMPGMDGVQLIETVRKIDPAIKGVILTAHVDDKEIERLKKNKNITGVEIKENLEQNLLNSINKYTSFKK